MIAALGLGVALPASGFAERDQGARAKTKDVTALFDRALRIVRSNPEFPKAVMLEADGTPSGSKPVKDASGIAKWRFVLVNAGAPGSDFAHVTLDYKGSSGFAEPVGHPEPFLEDVEIKRAPKMTLADAVSLLRDDGYRQPFFNVTLRNPLGPQRTAPLYIFGLKGEGFVAVNTKTEKVSPIS